jgi:hypothetical protein
MAGDLADDGTAFEALVSTASLELLTAASALVMEGLPPPAAKLALLTATRAFIIGAAKRGDRAAKSGRLRLGATVLLEAADDVVNGTETDEMIEAAEAAIDASTDRSGEVPTWFDRRRPG